MHIPIIEREGIKSIGDEYWNSFHVVKDGHWTSDNEAIVELFKLFPLSTVLVRILDVPVVRSVSEKLLNHFKRMRRFECKL
jgi:hypothetical protein